MCVSQYCGLKCLAPPFSRNSTENKIREQQCERFHANAGCKTFINMTAVVLIVQFSILGIASFRGRRTAPSPWVSSFPCREAEGRKGVPAPGWLALPRGTARCQEVRSLPSGRSVALAGRRAEASPFPAVVCLWA